MASALRESFRNKNELDCQHEETSKEREDFERLLIQWSDISKELLSLLNKNHDYVLKDRKAESAMALGALGAHLNMAIQAHKASSS